MRKKPIIGISCNYSYHDEQARLEGIGVRGQEWQCLANDYIEAVENAGGIPFIIPFVNSKELMLDMLEHIDGLIMSGGGDINPKYFNERPHPAIGTIIPHRDLQDLFICEHFLKNTNKPLLGICRGIQVMNVCMGGSILQHIDGVSSDFHTYAQFPKHLPSHSVAIEKDSLLYKIVNTQTLKVNSFHHQSVSTLGENIRAVASDNTIIEAIELADSDRFVLGVQWHPEMMHLHENPQMEIFKHFIKSCDK